MDQACLAEAPSDTEVARLKRLHERNPTSTIFARLADAYLGQGDAAGAIHVCRQGLRFRPSYITGHLVLAQAFTRVDDTQSAEDEFQKVLRLEPDNPAAIRYLATLAARSGDTERAEGLWGRLRTIDPFNPAIPDAQENDEEASDAAELPGEQETEMSENPVEKTSEPPSVEDTQEFPFVSLTLARLYASQGHKGRAERVARLVDPTQADEILVQFTKEAAT